MYEPINQQAFLLSHSDEYFPRVGQYKIVDCQMNREDKYHVLKMKLRITF